MPFKVKPKQDLQTIIFLHVPKTAGTSVQVLIQKQFDPSTVYEFDNSNAQQSMAVFKNLPHSEKEKYKIVLGHMWFGIHNDMSQPATYFTLLRDPIQRVISHYYFVKRRPDHYLYNIVESNHLTLKQYVENKLSSELNNGQTRLISGEMDEEKYYFGNCPGELLERAKENFINHFSLIGIQEEFENTLLLIQKIFNWKIIHVKENVTDDRPSPEAISPDTLEVIKKYNELDIQLYEFAKEQFARLKKKYLNS